MLRSSPPFVLEKLSLVIVPTISLQTDQSQSLNDRGIPATCLGSTNRSEAVYSEILQDQCRVIFVTPEALFDDSGQPKPFFIKLGALNKIGVIAVDEAHLMYSWRNFR